MAKTIYTAKAHVTGGRQDGHGRTDDGHLDVIVKPPGGESGTNPEQLFAVGYAACFGSAMEVVARRLKLEAADHSIESEVDLVTTEDRGFTVAVRMDITMPSIEDPEQALELVRRAHDVCPYSNATRGNIDMTLTVNGRPMD